jgi:hypothetical protein
MLMHGCQLGQLLMAGEGEESVEEEEKIDCLWKKKQLSFGAAWKTFFAVYIQETLPKFWKWTEETKVEG